MDNTKKGKTTPAKLESTSEKYKNNQEAVTPYDSKALYFDIANSVHGIGKGINNKIEGDEERVIKVELCQWKIPPVDKKENCKPQKCVPPPPTASEG